MRIIQTLSQLPQPYRLAIVGAGGKTTALFQIARQLSPPVIVTTTTHLGMDEIQQADAHFEITSPHQIDSLELMGGVYVILITGTPTPDQRVYGLAPDCLELLKERADQLNLPLLIEADGSRKKPLKAPASHEPDIPAWVNGVIVVAGLSGLEKPVGPEFIHRPEIFAQLCGLQPGDLIQPENLAEVLNSPAGGLKNIPAAAVRIALLNQADTDLLKASAQKIASDVKGSYDSVVIASLGLDGTGDVNACIRQVAGVVLAAGGSSRFGQPKSLLTWRGQSFVRTVAETALQSGLSPVIVITGAADLEIRAALSSLPVQYIHNEQWQSGQASSIQSALRILPPHVGGAIFLLVDQPQVPVRYIRSLLEFHQQSLAPIIIPQVNGQRATPVLFDRETFAELAKIEGDSGGRQIFSKFAVEWLPWNDDSLLLDVDSPEDYQRLLEIV